MTGKAECRGGLLGKDGEEEWKKRKGEMHRGVESGGEL